MPMSDALQRFERVYPVPVDTLWQALTDTVAAGKFKKAETDAFTHTAAFRSPRTLASWGHHWQAQAAPDGDGSRLVLTAAVTVSSRDAGSGKRASELATRLFTDVSTRCAAAR